MQAIRSENQSVASMTYSSRAHTSIIELITGSIGWTECVMALSSGVTILSNVHVHVPNTCWTLSTQAMMSIDFIFSQYNRSQLVPLKSATIMRSSHFRSVHRVKLAAGKACIQVHVPGSSWHRMQDARLIRVTQVLHFLHKGVHWKTNFPFDSFVDYLPRQRFMILIFNASLYSPVLMDGEVVVRLSILLSSPSLSYWSEFIPRLFQNRLQQTCYNLGDSINYIFHDSATLCSDLFICLDYTVWSDTLALLLLSSYFVSI